MQISVKYFASLRELVGTAEATMDVAEQCSVNDVWQSVIAEHNVHVDRIMMTVNHEYVKPEHQLYPGDEVAFFPPVTGG